MKTFPRDPVNIDKGFGLDSSNTSLIILTVINVTDGTNEERYDQFKPITEESNVKRLPPNNPPQPPFINTNTLKTSVNISVYVAHLQAWSKRMISDAQITININKLVDDIKSKFMNYRKVFYTRLILYPFYLNDPNFMKLINAPSFMDLFNTETTKKYLYVNQLNSCIDHHNKQERCLKIYEYIS